MKLISIAKKIFAPCRLDRAALAGNGLRNAETHLGADPH